MCPGRTTSLTPRTIWVQGDAHPDTCPPPSPSYLASFLASSPKHVPRNSAPFAVAPCSPYHHGFPSCHALCHSRSTLRELLVDDRLACCSKTQSQEMSTQRASLPQTCHEEEVYKCGATSVFFWSKFPLAYWNYD